MGKLTYLPAQPLAGGIYKMALGPAQLFELENGPRTVWKPIGEGGAEVEITPLRRDSGAPTRAIYEIFAGIMAGRMEVDGTTVGNAFQAGASMSDIANIVRLGLIGGGMEASEAAALVAANGPPHAPLNDLWEIAAALVYAVLVGVEEPADD